MSDDQTPLRESLTNRYGKIDFEVPSDKPALTCLANRGSCRSFTDKPVDFALINTLCAVALASPTKSDLQQRDIIIVQEDRLRAEINSLFSKDSWVRSAPSLLVFCGNNRRQRQLSNWRQKPFPNDHLDAFFNASVDAGIALSAFVIAAELIGLGCCPISEIRNHCDAISRLLQLPQHVFPIAGLAVGWPAESPSVSMRLPLSVTVHRDKFSEADVRDRVNDYDQRRASQQPYSKQRFAKQYGPAQNYGWSEDKARQYSEAQRTDFSEFIRAKGFVLD